MIEALSALIWARIIIIIRLRQIVLRLGDAGLACQLSAGTKGDITCGVPIGWDSGMQ